MKPFTSTHRVCYSDTDQMGVVHHSNYLRYYETARWDLFRHLGKPYKELEAEGFELPVVHLEIAYLQPAFYDEVLVIETSLLALKGVRLKLANRIFNNAGALINSATITLAFTKRNARKACRPPAFLQQQIIALINGDIYLVNEVAHKKLKGSLLLK